MLSSRRFIIAVIALGLLFVLGLLGLEQVGGEIAAVALGLAGANASEALISAILTRKKK